MTDKRATEIINTREKNGPFTNRKQLLNVKGIGAKVFEQCAGFLRVKPVDIDEATFYKQKDTNKLDRTDIHPESYDTTRKLLKRFKLDVSDIGTRAFINRIKAEINPDNVEKLSTDLNVPKETTQLILESLSEPLNYDLRSALSNTPLFKKGLTDINELKTGTILTGRVENVTHFGAFVDVGVSTNGLIHTSKMNGCELALGHRVEVKVINLEIERKRIGLECLRVLRD